MPHPATQSTGFGRSRGSPPERRRRPIGRPCRFRPRSGSWCSRTSRSADRVITAAFSRQYRGLDLPCPGPRVCVRQERKRPGFTRTMAGLAVFLEDGGDILRVRRDSGGCGRTRGLRRTRRRKSCHHDQGDSQHTVRSTEHLRHLQVTTASAVSICAIARHSLTVTAGAAARVSPRRTARAAGQGRTAPR